MAKELETLKSEEELKKNEGFETFLYNDEHLNMKEGDVEAHIAATKVRTVDQIEFGKS